MKKEVGYITLNDTTEWGDNFWKPTPLLRWQVIEEKGWSNKILQQLWVNGSGEEEWRDVPIEEHISKQ